MNSPMTESDWAFIESLSPEQRATIDRYIQHALHEMYLQRDASSPMHSHPDIERLREFAGGLVVYCFYDECRHLFKIGYSKNVEKRIESIANALRMPRYRLRFIWANRHPSERDAQSAEKQWHAEFAPRREGNHLSEWFHLTPDDISRFCEGSTVGGRLERVQVVWDEQGEGGAR